MNFGMITQNQSTTKKHNYFIWIQIISLTTQKEKIFIKIIVNDVEERFYTSNYELEKLLPKGKYKKVTGLMKNELMEK